MKTLTSQKHRALLTARKLLQEKFVAIENDIRGLLRNFGLKVGSVGVLKFDHRIRELVEGLPDLVEILHGLFSCTYGFLPRRKCSCRVNALPKVLR